MTNLDIRLNVMRRYRPDRELTDVEIESAKQLEPIVFEMPRIIMGSEKQIGDAYVICLTMATNAIKLYNQYSVKCMIGQDEALKSMMSRLINKVFGHTDAKYYIDNRTTNIYRLMLAENK
jgi:hypothetical protein